MGNEMPLRWIAGAVTLAAAVAGPAWAHHSVSGQFDLGRRVTLTGTISEVDWINSHNRLDASVENISDEMTLLSLQGPKAAAILQPLTGVRLDAVRHYHFTRGKVLNVDAIVSRTGYTGEDGFELYFPAEQSELVWKGILEAGSPLDLVPAGPLVDVNEVDPGGLDLDDDLAGPGRWLRHVFVA